LDASPQWKHGKGSLGQMVIKGDNGLEVTLSQMTFDADTPAWRDGKAFFDLAKVQARQFTLALPGLPGPEPALTMAELHLTLSRKPERSADRVEVKGLTWREKPGDKLHLALKELGFERLSLDLVYDYDYDIAGKVLECRELTLAAAQAGRFTLGFVLKNFDYDLSGDNARTLAALKNCRPASLTLRYEDDSLADRVLTLGAKKEGLELEAFRAKLLKDMPPLPGALEADPALLEFVKKPGKLCLKLTPRQDMTAEELAKTGPILLAMLNFQLDNCPAPSAGR
jgi:hypothetical protein